jgi:hypothetical protein
MTPGRAQARRHDERVFRLMTDSTEHNPQPSRDPIVGQVVTIGVVGAALVAVVVLGLIGLVEDMIGAERRIKIEQVPWAEVDAMQAAQERQLTTEPHIELRGDPAEPMEALVIPIDRAMELTIQEYQRSE